MWKRAERGRVFRTFEITCLCGRGRNEGESSGRLRLPVYVEEGGTRESVQDV